MMNIEKKPIYPTVLHLKIGERVAYPIARTMSVRSTCSAIRTIYERGLEVTLDRPNQIVIVKRIS